MKTPPLPHLLLHESVMKLEEAPHPSTTTTTRPDNTRNSDEGTLYLLGFVGIHAAKVLLMCREAEFGSKVTTAGAEIPFSLNSPQASSFASSFSHPHFFSTVAE